MEVGEKFTSLSSYNDNMRKAIADKLFFIDRIFKGEKEYPPKHLYVDFGCADGSLLFNLKSKESTIGNYYYIGYDISNSMIDLAKQNCPFNDRDILFTNKWSTVESALKNHKTYSKCLILSSVIHEVYSYGTDDDVIEFWDRVIESGFDYIVIRDMLPSVDIDRKTDPDFAKHVYHFAGFDGYDKQLEEFESIHGPITSYKNLIHFSLKIPWQVNWNREVKENYFPIYVEDLIKTVTRTSKYNLDYLERFSVDYVKELSRHKFNFSYDDYTHAKLIFSKNHAKN